jgi:hypothetical protein
MDEHERLSKNVLKCSGCSSYSVHNFPMKNLLPNNSVFINVPYFGIPISKGVNSTHSENNEIRI